MSIETDLLSMCGVREEHGDPRCTHVSQVLTPLSSTSAAHSKLACALSRMYLLSTDCPTLARWLEIVALGLGKLLDTRILAGEYHGDFLRDDRSASEQHYYQIQHLPR